ncbi:dynactin subunit 2-like [Artemia franciscana]|uniref:Dynactin subunit 2 n=1 Tax=Artemia franciscana TaxID=6661 RepID=A0AA88HRR9_ARTSF|nr:hypothetical protein QYM36_013446 [Artemia franciscana]
MDPKYSGLPGIAHDQPDVYETSDLPEADQDYEFGVDTSDSIEQLHISTNESISKFRGRWLDGSKVDFSDNIAKRKKSGYIAQNELWELQAQGEPETPLQKFRRLQCETKELLEDLSSAKEDQIDGVPLPVLAGQVEELIKQLVSLKTEEVTGASFNTSSEAQRELLSKIQSIASSKSEPGKEQQAVYELFVSPEKTDSLNMSKMMELNQRLNKLETLLGADPDALARLTAQHGKKGLVGIAAHLANQAHLFEISHVDKVETRLGLVAQRLSQLAEKSAQVEDADKLNKISVLYELLKKSEALCESLPDIIERLASLNSLHEQAVQFSQNLTELDLRQQEVVSGLESYRHLLKEVKNGFSENFDAIKGNMEALQARIDQLLK